MSAFGREKATAAIKTLIESDELSINFGEVHRNPHIKALKTNENQKQIEKISADDANS